MPRPLVVPVGPEALELRRLQGSLEATDQRFQDLFEDAPVACHEIDQNGLLVRVNRAECALLGFEASEMVGRPVWEFMVAEERDKSQEAVRRWP